MSAADIEPWFPRLRQDGYAITSPEDPGHNCVAYSLRDHANWWDPNRPDGYWPNGVPRDDTVDGFVVMFESQGFELCATNTVEEGYEKIALYGDSGGDFLHVALQLDSGEWTSKLGELEDIQHNTVNGLVSIAYGEPQRFMRRRLPQHT